MSSGFSALVACIVVGRRKDVDNKKPAVPHNVPFVLLGAAILVCGEKRGTKNNKNKKTKYEKKARCLSASNQYYSGLDGSDSMEEVHLLPTGLLH